MRGPDAYHFAQANWEQVSCSLGISSTRLRTSMAPYVRVGKDESVSRRDTFSTDAFLSQL